MKYHIKNDKGNIIASFVNEYDRDYCQDALSIMFEDCEFFAYTDDE